MADILPVNTGKNRAKHPIFGVFCSSSFLHFLPVHSKLMNEEQRDKQFTEVYEEFSDVIFRHCYFRVNNREKALDLTQETFVKTWTYIKDGGVPNNPKAFLYTVANNLIVDWYRKKKESSLDQLQAQGFDPSGSDYHKLMHMVESGHLLRLLTQLGQKYRDVITMSYVDGFSNKEIARLIGETENNVAVRIYRGLQKLKEIAHHGSKKEIKTSSREPSLVME